MKTPTLPLFVPGHRIDILPKAVASGADMVIVDLEDAVAEVNKLEAQAKLSSCVSVSVPLAVRINTPGCGWFDSDLAAVLASPAKTIILPKAETTADIDRIMTAIGSDITIIPIIESARGLAALASLLAHPAVPLCAFGHLDFSLDIGASSEWNNLLYVRSQLVVESRLAGVAPPLDGVTVSFDIPDIVKRDARRASDLGFGGKLLIHPRQVAPALSVFRPSQDDYAWALKVLVAVAENPSAIQLDGDMIDMPVIKRAERIKKEFELLLENNS